ncbi:MAG: TonB-dependent receptor [Desulfobacterium sp.]
MQFKMATVFRMIFLISFIFIAGLPQISQGEEETVTLDDVVVTATKQIRSVRDTPSTITVITAEDIEKSNAQTVPEALKGIPGVVVEERYGLSSEIVLRGNAFRKYGYTLVLVDGMPMVSSDTGRVYWEMIPLSNVEQIEVVMGPGSALWGGNAFGGTVNIITKKPEVGASAKVSSKIGEYGLRHLSFYGSVAGEKGWKENLSLQASVEKKQAEGWRTNSDYDNENYWIKVGKEFNELNAAIDLTVSSSHRDQSVPNSITQAMWDSNDLTTPKSDDYYYAYHNGYVDYQRLTFEKGIGQTSRVKANVYNRHQEYDYLYTKFTTVDNKTMGGGLEYDLKLGKHSLVMGVDAENNDLCKLTINHDSNYNPDWSNLKSKKDLQTDIDKYAVYAQDSWKISKSWEAIFGLRWDWAEFDNSGYKYNRAGTTKTDVTGSSRVDGYSPQVNLLYKLNKNFNFYTSIGRAFKIPTPSQLYTVDDYANPDLEAETATSYEIGMKYSFQKVSGSVAVYLSDVDDLVAKNETTVQYENIGKAQNRGVEGSIAYRIIDSLTVNLNANYTRMEIKENPSDTSIEGKYLDQVPEYTVSLGLDYTLPMGFSASVVGRKIGPWYMDSANEEEYSGHYLADCKLGFKSTLLGQEFHWSVGCNNLFDKKYAASAYTSRSSNLYYPGMPRNFFTKIGFDF